MEKSTMFADLDKWPVILVTGPQRSGTTIAAKMIANDTGHEYIDEKYFDAYDVEKWRTFMEGSKVVIQCPAMCKEASGVDRDDVLVVMMMRSTDDIKASQRRIDWSQEERELIKYSEDGDIAEVKYNYWAEHKPKHYLEVRYDDLQEHEMWVPQEKRQNFAPKQTI